MSRCHGALNPAHPRGNRPRRRGLPAYARGAPARRVLGRGQREQVRAGHQYSAEPSRRFFDSLAGPRARSGVRLRPHANEFFGRVERPAFLAVLPDLRVDFRGTLSRAWIPRPLSSAVDFVPADAGGIGRARGPVEPAKIGRRVRGPHRRPLHPGVVLQRHILGTHADSLPLRLGVVVRPALCRHAGVEVVGRCLCFVRSLGLLPG